MRSTLRRPFTAVLLVALLIGLVPPAPTEAQRRPGRGPWVPSWDVTYGGFRALDDLAPMGPDQAWALDATRVTTGRGAIDQTLFIHRDGDVWRAAQVETGVRASAVALVGDALGFAVGDDGVIFRFDGRRWTRFPSPTVRSLRDVALSGPETGYAVGTFGTLLRWDGRAWWRVPDVVPSDIDFLTLEAVAAPAPGEAWVACRCGDLLRFDDGEWTHHPAFGVGRTTALVFDGPDRGLLAGEGLALWDGREWQVIEGPAPAYSDAALVPDGAGAYVIGVTGDRLWYYSEERFEPVTFETAPVATEQLPYRRLVATAQDVLAIAADGTTVALADGTARYVRPAVASLLALDVPGDALGWAGGDALSAGFIGRAADDRWSRRVELPVGSQVHDIALSGADDGFAVGYVPTDPIEGRMWRWDGASWTAWSINKTWVVEYVEWVAEDEAWASGGNIVLRWDGEAWAQVPDAPLGAEAGAHAMRRGGDDPAGFFGGFGVVYHLHDGQWDEHTLPVDGRVIALAAPADDEAWAATSSTLLRWDGASWSEVSLPLTRGATLQDVDAERPGDAWVAVDPDGLYHWTGERWEYHSLDPMGVSARPARLDVRRLESGGYEIWLAGPPSGVDASPVVARYEVVEPRGTVYLPRAGKDGS